MALVCDTLPACGQRSAAAQGGSPYTWLGKLCVSLPVPLRGILVVGLDSPSCVQESVDGLLALLVEEARLAAVAVMDLGAFLTK